jgi:hypothetical protein
MDSTALLQLLHDWLMADQRITRLRAGNELREQAAARNISLDELSDFAVPDIDLRDKIIESRWGSYQIELRTDLTTNLLAKNSKMNFISAVILARLEEYTDYQQLLNNVRIVLPILLERAMIDGRRWSREQFEQFFVKHHINTYIAQSLVWGIYEGDQLRKAFHITSDLTPADEDYRGFTLPENAQVGVVHPLELSEEQRERWRILLHDYEIIQPFPQINRMIYPAEALVIIQKPRVSPFMRKSSYAERTSWEIFQQENRQGFKRQFRKQNTTVYIMVEGNLLFMGKLYKFQNDQRVLEPSEVAPLVISETIYAMVMTMREIENP